MADIPDAPWIRECEATGHSTYGYWNSPPPEREPVCPVCGESCDTFYRDKAGDVVGCENCVTSYDAWEELGDV